MKEEANHCRIDEVCQGETGEEREVGRDVSGSERGLGVGCSQGYLRTGVKRVAEAEV